jgi:hypothetical protein
MKTLAIATCLGGLAPCACDSDAATTGRRVVLHTNATAEPATRAAFTTGFGWDVTLTKAAVATSALYYFDGPPPTAMRSQSFGERLASLFIGTAWAHPGHYQAGTAVGQVLLATPVALDLFAATPIPLPDGEGVTGVYRSARFVIPSSAPPDAAVAGHVAIAEGRALKHDGSSTQPIFFRLVADYADISGSIKNGAVDGCVLDETTVTDTGTINVEIKPTVWLNLVDFSTFAPGTEASPTETRNAGFSQGVTQLSAYAFHVAN